MSWDSYIDNLIGHSKDGAGSPQCSKACILGLDGGMKWTSDSHAFALQISVEESAVIANAFKSKNIEPFQANGITVGGTKYRFLRMLDEKAALAKMKDVGAITVQASKTAVVIGFTPEGCQQGSTNKAVGVICDYLESVSM